MTADIPRLSDDELTALLAAHRNIGKWIDLCEKCGWPWPCETVRLATEVRDLRAVKDWEVDSSG